MTAAIIETATAIYENAHKAAQLICWHANTIAPTGCYARITNDTAGVVGVALVVLCDANWSRCAGTQALMAWERAVMRWAAQNVSRPVVCESSARKSRYQAEYGPTCRESLLDLPCLDTDSNAIEAAVSLGQWHACRRTVSAPAHLEMLCRETADAAYCYAQAR